MAHPETDQDLRERLLRVVDRGDRADVMVASGYGLDGFARIYGMARKGLPEGSFSDPIVEGFRQLEREMAGPAIVSLAPGERPTEPGWYVVQWPVGDRYIVEMHSDRKGGFDVQQTGVEMWLRLEEVLQDGWAFIARIYPDRIEGREG